MAKHRSNAAWLREHLTDPYVKLAQKHGYRARAAFKLKEIDERDGLIRPGQLIVDMGSAPGSWCQYARNRMRNSKGELVGRIIALDCLAMEPIDGVEFLQGDFREPDFAIRVDAAIATTGALPCVDLVLSDMAPNLSGIEAADAARMQDLVELAREFAFRHLKPGGSLLVKAFHGRGYSQLVQTMRHRFASVSSRKPAASRSRSAETYLLARVPRRVAQLVAQQTGQA